jgi:hypothetical protein
MLAARALDTYPFGFLLAALAFVVYLPIVVGGGTQTTPPPGPFVSDDFNACLIDEGLWTLVDPRGDGSATINGTQLLLSVPGGVAHDVWNDGNIALRLMQPANDTDFELEVKFESGVDAPHQLQGVLVEQEEGNFIRFDFHSREGGTRVFAATFLGGSPTILHDSGPLPGGTTPLYLKVRRQGNTWTQSYSVDGQSWTQATSFSHAMRVSQVGVFAGNAGPSPAHTAVVDYFFNTAAPINPEDGRTLAYSLTVNAVGNGSVSRVPDKASYACGEVVTLTAVPGPGHTFAGWSGALTGAANPASLTMTADQTLSATFAPDTIPPVISDVQVAVEPDGTGATVSWVTDEPATSRVAYGPSTAYENGVVGTDDPVTTSHRVILSGLTVGQLYHFQVRSADGMGNVATSADRTFTPTSTLPEISIWYGSVQKFGHIGTAQRWVNVLGNVADEDGVASLVYSLNQGPTEPVSLGPDTRRLANPGDFNVEIDRAALVAGQNQVVITATDVLGYSSSETVIIDYAGGNVWPLPYTASWGSTGSVQDVAQVVDGLWTLTPGGLRPAEVGYDRGVAIGDITWADYEVVVPITLHSIDSDGFDYPSDGPGLGMLLHWLGHSDDPVPGWQPKAGWEPFGAIGWWRWPTDTSSAQLEFLGSGYAAPSTPAISVRYLFKMRVESVAGQGTIYKLRVWEDGKSEPAEWNLVYPAGSTNLDRGSVLLLAHHVDATFGEVTVSPLPLEVSTD